MIEFIFVSLVFVFMLVLTFNAVIAMSVQQYLSYAVFMAARAYQAGTEVPENQSSNAAATLARFMRDVPVASLASSGNASGSFEVRFPMFRTKPVAVVTKLVIPRPTPYSYGAGGVVEADDLFVGAEFDVSFVSLPLGPSFQNLQRLSLKARSYLGREVTQSECEGFFERFYRFYEVNDSTNGAGRARAQNLFLHMDDNGC